MTASINMALYRVLVKLGADEREAEAAATYAPPVTFNQRATYADLAAQIADLRAQVQALQVQLDVVGTTGGKATVATVQRPL